MFMIQRPILKKTVTERPNEQINFEMELLVIGCICYWILGNTWLCPTLYLLTAQSFWTNPLSPFNLYNKYITLQFKYHITAAMITIHRSFFKIWKCSEIISSVVQYYCEKYWKNIRFPAVYQGHSCIDNRL